MGKLRLMKKIRAAQAAQAAQAAAAQTAQTAKAEQNQQALAQASAIKDSGRTTDKVAENSTNQAAAPVSNNGGAVATGLDDDTSLYINNLQNRRKKRGAPMAQMSGVLGQPATLGV